MSTKNIGMETCLSMDLSDAKNSQLKRVDELEKIVASIDSESTYHKLQGEQADLRNKIYKIRQSIINSNQLNNYYIRYELNDLATIVDRLIDKASFIIKHPVLCNACPSGYLDAKEVLGGHYNWLFLALESRYINEIPQLQYIQDCFNLFREEYLSKLRKYINNLTVAELNLDLVTEYSYQEATTIIVFMIYAIYSEVSKEKFSRIVQEQIVSYSDQDEGAKEILIALEDIQMLIGFIGMDILRLIRFNSNNIESWPYGEASIYDSMKEQLNKYKLTPGFIPKLKMIGKSSYNDLDFTRLILIDTLRLMLEP